MNEPILASESQAFFDRAMSALTRPIFEIQQPRSDYALEHFVILQHDTAPMQYLQCVLELQVKASEIERLKIEHERCDLLAMKATEDMKGQPEIEQRLLALDAREQDRRQADIRLSMTGLMREFRTLFAIWESFPVKYTHAEIQAAQEEYWAKRIQRQLVLGNMAARQGFNPGDLDARRQIEAQFDRAEGLLPIQTDTAAISGSIAT